MPARIVQLSDLHLTAGKGARVRGVDVWASLETTLRDVRETVGGFDRMVLTGDLANQRRPATYERLREVLEQWSERLRVLPGNHDDRSMLRASFGDLLEPGGGSANFVDRLAGWTLLGLDSLRRHRVHGRLGEAQLRWLGERLRSAEGPVLVFVHHPPVRVGTWWLDKDLLRDRAQLEDLVRGSGVRALVCGHVHQDAEGSFAGARVWTTPSTAYQFAPGSLLPRTSAREPAYRLLQLDGDRIDSRVLFPGRPRRTGRAGESPPDRTP